MSKEEYMNQLSELLMDIPMEERQDAIRYYEDYFADAGIENADKLLEQLESPEKVANAIRENYFGKASTQDGEYTETGYRDPQFEKNYEIIFKGDLVKGKESQKKEKNCEYKESNQYNESNSYQNGWNQDQYNQNSGYQNTGYQNQNYQNQAPYKSSNRTALIIVLCVLASPFLLGIAGTAISLFFGVFGGLIGIIFALFGSSIALVAGAIGSVVLGISKFSVNPASGFIGIGAGFIMAAIGILIFIAVINFVHWLIPTFAGLVQKAYHKIVKKRGMRNENIY